MATATDYGDEWRRIREVIREKMRADLRPVFVDPHPEPPMDIWLPAFVRPDAFYIVDPVNS